MKKVKYLNHTLNSSPSKQAHSFGTAQRFKTQKDNTGFQFNPQRIKSKQTCSFGIGQRASPQRDMARRSPSPNRYYIKSEFDDHNKGYSFGQIKSQKDKINEQKRLEKRLNTQTDKYTTYSPNKFNTTARVSIGDRQSVFTQSKYGYSPSKDVPGPGSYNIFSCFGTPKGHWNNPY